MYICRVTKFITMERKICTYPGFEGFYYIYEDGQVYSLQKKKFLKLSHSARGSIYDYLRVTLCVGKKTKVVYLAPLVLHHFVSPMPVGCEANHKDLNKMNNHYTNLEWITHQQNILHARNKKKWIGKRPEGFKIEDNARKKMAKAKFKKILLFNDNEHIVYESIEEFVIKNNTYRKLFNRLVNSCKTYNGYYIRYL